jgi:hypothetical protein
MNILKKIWFYDFNLLVSKWEIFYNKTCPPHTIGRGISLLIFYTVCCFVFIALTYEACVSR